MWIKRITICFIVLFFVCCSQALYIRNKDGTIYLLVNEGEEESQQSSWIGIPQPPFGIDETYRMYDSEANRSESLTYYESDSGGYYTHYVDSSDENSTDTDNDYGTKAKPRKTIPRGSDDGLPIAGSVIEIHNSMDDNGWDSIYVGGEGTENQPIFYRAINMSFVDHGFNIGYYDEASYIIAEGLKGRGSTVRGFISDWGSFVTHHIAVRDCNFYSPENEVGVGFGVSGSQQNPSRYVVFNNCDAHDGGYWDCEINGNNEMDFFEYASDEAAQAVWSGTGVAVTTTSTDVENSLYNSTYALVCTIDATGNRSVERSQTFPDAPIPSYFDGMEFYSKCSTSSSSFQFYIRDSSSNESYWDETTDGDVNEWKFHACEWGDEDSNNGTDADEDDITDWGFKGLDADEVYQFDTAYFEGDTDDHACTINDYCDHVWILDCNLYHVDGDGMQIRADPTSNPGDSDVNNIYIAGCTAYENKQMGYWVKDANHVVFSQNTARDLIYNSTSGGGTGFGWQYDPKGVLFIFNTAQNCRYGFAGASSGGYRKDVFFIGNLCYDCIYQGIRLDTLDKTGQAPVCFNVFYNCDVSIGTGYQAGEANLFNNVYAEYTSAYDLDDDNSSYDDCDSDYCLYDGSGNIIWDTTYANLAAFVSGTDEGDNSDEDDPLFTDSNNDDYSLGVGSPAFTIGVSTSDANDLWSELDDLGFSDISDYAEALFIDGTVYAP